MTMNPATNTPGPWRANGGQVELANGMASTVATCAGLRPGDAAKTTGERLANARLIAAAPDMLAALRAVLSVADRKTAEFDLVRAAIARATGAKS